MAGIQTSQDARFYGLSTKFTRFSNKDKPLVVQFTVKHEQNIDCGGGYVKLFDCSLPQGDMHGDSPYLIMFGIILLSSLFLKQLLINMFYSF
jgi:calreticulin